ncbi:MAG TPA: DsbE family thiol:disulfide interchange protein [Usitatibacter sp.]|nr:DsbE family thiol:disulfide interchange protein [Usitatibacter sp.]
MKNRRSLWIPLAAFAVLAAFLGVGLTLNPRELPSPLVGKPAPAFSLPQLHAAAEVMAPEHLRGKVYLLNVWASWCSSCRAEHEHLMALAGTRELPIYGLDYKDERDAGIAWLHRNGNPYVASAFDAEGRAGIDWGVYGVPETFLVDAQGVVRYKHVGPLTPAVIEGRILPLARELARHG